MSRLLELGGEHLPGRRERREEHVPAAQLSAQFHLLLDDDGLDTPRRKPQSRLHARDTAAHDDHSFLHLQKYRSPAAARPFF